MDHLTRRYRQPTKKRIEAIGSALPHTRPSDTWRREEYHRLESVFRSLCDELDEHAWLEDQVLCPAVEKVERDRASTDSAAREALCELILSVNDDHRRLRRIADALARAVAQLTRAPVPVDEAVLAADLDILVLLLREQADLEDRCLWPRALNLLQHQG